MTGARYQVIKLLRRGSNGQRELGPRVPFVCATHYMQFCGENPLWELVVANY